MRAALLEFPDAPADAAEAAVVRRLPFRFQVTCGTDGQVNALVEIVTRFAVTATHLVGDVGGEKGPDLCQESLIVVAEFDAAEIHCHGCF
jgi:hypothetical protein